jgi:hypothetical protein
MRTWWIFLGLALAYGAFCRLACLGAEFWLDEIWSWELARQAGSAWGIFRSRHDNNHHLNTLLLRLWPDGAPFGWYRLPSLVAGLVSIVLAARIARRWGQAEAAFAAFLVAGCYWLVLASVEARGYALAVCFALAALDALWGYLDTGSRASLACFWGAAILGFLSHLTFAHAYLGFVVWSLRRFARQRSAPSEELRRLAVLHGVPAAFFVVFYLACVRGMEIGGGPKVPVVEVLVRLVSLGLGGPAGGSWAAWWWLAGVVLLALGLALSSRPRSDVWVFFAASVVGAPVLFLLRPAPFLYERYFLIPFVFFMLLVARVLGELCRTGEPTALIGRLMHALFAVALLGGFLAGSAVRVRAFVEAGRGEFRQALGWVVSHAPEGTVTITGDHDFRVHKYVEFYTHHLPDSAAVEYLGQDDLPRHGAGWLLVHRLDDRWPPGEVERDARGNEYRLEVSYPSRGPGCWGWFVYRNARRPR